MFLTDGVVSEIIKALERFGMKVSTLATSCGYDLVVEVPALSDGFMVVGSSLVLQLDGSSYASLMSGAIGFVDDCERAADPMAANSEDELRERCGFRNAARCLLDTLESVLA